MAATHTEQADQWTIPVNDKGKEDWECSNCGRKLSSCCGNSHIWCYSCSFTLWSAPNLPVDLAYWS